MSAAIEEILTNSSVIHDYLSQLVENNTPLSLTILDCEDSAVYHSRIQSLESAKKQIVLKQVLPSDWREKVTSASKVEIKSYMNTGNIRFRGLMTKLDDSVDSPYCMLSFPSKIYRLQLRDYYRVSLAKTPSNVALQLDDSTALQGSCRDISMSGAMISLSKNVTTLEVGQNIERCGIYIDDILELNLKGEVRSLHSSGSELLAGIQFVDLTPAQLKPISSALNKIERMNINN